MNKVSIAKKLLRIADELIGGGRRLRREDVTERDFPILEVFDWEFIEEDGGYGRVNIIEGKSVNELKEIFERKLGKPIGYVGAYISKDLYTDIYYGYDSRDIMENMAEEDTELTKQLQDDFENYDGGGWSDWIKIYNEHAVNKILEDLKRVLKPKSLTIIGEFSIRGGAKNKITATYKKR
jgi:hypothetical protein